MGKQHPVMVTLNAGGGVGVEVETLSAGRGAGDWRWSTGVGAGKATVPPAEVRSESILVDGRPGLGDGR